MNTKDYIYTIMFSTVALVYWIASFIGKKCMTAHCHQDWPATITLGVAVIVIYFVEKGRANKKQQY